MTQIPEHLQKMHDELSQKIEEYFQAWWAYRNDGDSGDYVSCWALVANFGNLSEASAAGYIVETEPVNMPPHAMKGLLSEGVDWVCEMQELNLGEEDDL